MGLSDGKTDELYDHDSNLDAMMFKMNEQIVERRNTLSARSSITSQVTLSRRFSEVDNFRFSKEILCKMSVKELGILLSCLMPLV